MGSGNKGNSREQARHFLPAHSILTVPEVADWLRVRPSTIYTWAASGKLPCLRIGGRIRFLLADVLRWLEARKEG
ncbi:MAG: hypothetical protein A49_11930 [Methyloceanibacter sp.]|nr:MAG: hypothetical protein A49_11930 [Methyloceanibacter sp.]